MVNFHSPSDELLISSTFSSSYSYISISICLTSRCFFYLSFAICLNLPSISFEVIFITAYICYYYSSLWRFFVWSSNLVIWCLESGLLNMVSFNKDDVLRVKWPNVIMSRTWLYGKYCLMSLYFSPAFLSTFVLYDFSIFINLKLSVLEFLL